MNPSDEQDDLWRLLGKARPVEPSAFFARNVLREVRGTGQQRRAGWAVWLLRPRPLAWIGVAMASLAIVCTLQFVPASVDTEVVIAEQVSKSSDYLVIADLDELLASEENSLWLEKPAY